MTFNQHYKLYRNGDFYDVAADPEEKRPLQNSQPTAEAAKVRAVLQAGLDQYRDARPANLAQPGRVEQKAKKAKKNKAA
jgi:hypothetical protein